MKKNILLLLTIAFVGFAVSCSEDDPEPDKIVGEWLLTSVVNSPPSDFSLTTFEDDGTFYGEASYTLEFSEGLLYDRDLVSIPGFGGFSDAGDYKIENGNLILSANSGITNANVNNIFKIIDEADDEDMVLEAARSLTLVPDAIWSNQALQDTLDFTSNEEVSQIYAVYGEQVSISANMTFEKQ